MTTTLDTNQVIDHLFLLTLLSSRNAERGKLFDKVIATTQGRPDGEKTYQIEIRVNGVEVDFCDFTQKVHEQLDEMIMGAARKLLDEQFAERFRTISESIYSAEQHAKDLRSALENEVRKAWGMPPRLDGDD